MVFVGHVATQWPTRGAFGQLDHLKLGDKISYLAGNQVYQYTVSRMVHIDPNQVDRLFQEKGDEIILVTCSGYNRLSDTFNTRLIAFASLDQVSTLETPSDFKD